MPLSNCDGTTGEALRNVQVSSISIPRESLQGLLENNMPIDGAKQTAPHDDKRIRARLHDRCETLVRGYAAGSGVALGFGPIEDVAGVPGSSIIYAAGVLPALPLGDAL